MPPLPEPDDALLVARLRAGDDGAWSLLVRRYERLVYAVARRGGLDTHQAADVFQTVFLRLMQHLPRIAEPSRLQAWIVTTARREVLSHHRRQARWASLDDVPQVDGPPAEDGAPVDPLHDRPDESPGPEEALHRWQRVMRVWTAWERLDESCRRLLELLFAAEPAGYEGVSRRLGMPMGSIGPTRARCLAKLRRLAQ